MTIEITIPLFLIEYGFLILAALATVSVGFATRSYLQERKHRKTVAARIEGLKKPV